MLAAIVDESGSMRVGRKRPLADAADEALRAWFGALEGEDQAARIVDERVVRDRRAAPLVHAAQPFRFEPALAIALRALPRGASLLAITDGFDLARGELLARAALRFDATVLLARDPWYDDFRYAACALARRGNRAHRPHLRRPARARTLPGRGARARIRAAGTLPRCGLAHRHAARKRRPRIAAARVRAAGVTFAHPLWLLGGLLAAAALWWLRASHRGVRAALRWRTAILRSSKERSRAGSIPRSSSRPSRPSRSSLSAPRSRDRGSSRTCRCEAGDRAVRRHVRLDACDGRRPDACRGCGGSGAHLRGWRSERHAPRHRRVLQWCGRRAAAHGRQRGGARRDRDAFRRRTAARRSATRSPRRRARCPRRASARSC